MIPRAELESHVRRGETLKSIGLMYGCDPAKNPILDVRAILLNMNGLCNVDCIAFTIAVKSDGRSLLTRLL